jgi:acetolactate synthase small subunit
MREFAIHATHRPGEIGRIANILAKVGVNIKSIAAMSINNQGMIRVIPDDIEATRSSLQQANVRFDESEVVQVLVENKAGELAEVADKLSNAGINLLAMYVTGVAGDMVELAVISEDPKKAKKLLE